MISDHSVTKFFTGIIATSPSKNMATILKGLEISLPTGTEQGPPIIRVLNNVFMVGNAARNLQLLKFFLTPILY